MSKVEETTTKLAIGAAAAVSATYVGSIFGDQGTLVGVALGAIVAGGATQLYQAALERGKHHFKSIGRRNKYIMQGFGVGLAAVALGFGGLTAIEAATHKPLHAITTNSNERGTTLGGTTSVTINPTSQTPSPAPSVSISPSFSSSALPSISPSSASPSMPSPSPDPTPSSSSTPTAVPSPQFSTP